MFSTLFSALPSLPLPSLPGNIQRRLFSFLLTKTIGKFVRGGLDGEGVEADLRGGRVKLREVELDGEAITPLLSSLPLTFESGTISSISAAISSPLSLTTAPALTIEVDDILLVLRVSPSTLDVPPPPSPTDLNASTSTLGTQTTAETTTDMMAESTLSLAVASEFVKTSLSPLEDAELRSSLHGSPSIMSASFISSSSDLPGLPGAFGGGQQAEDELEEEREVEVTLLASLIERILARLHVNVSNVRLRLVWGDDDAEEAVELRVEEVEYRREEPEEGVTALGGVKVEWNKLESVRSVSVKGFQVVLRTHERQEQEEEEEGRATPIRRASTSSEETSSEEEDIAPEHDMMMSQSIADLRTSFVSATSSVAGGASMYASARGSTMEDIGEASSGSSSEEDSPFLDPEAGSPPHESTPQDSATEHDDHFRLLLSFGSDPLIFVLSVPKAPSPDPSSPRRRLPPPELNVQSSIAGPVTLLLFPPQTLAILRLLSLFNTASTPSSLPSPPARPTATTAGGPSFTLAVTLRTVSILLGTSTSLPPPSPTTLSHFWEHPISTSLDHPHLRLRLEGLGAWLVRLPHEEEQSVFPLRAFSLVEVSAEGKTLPIVISDWNLSKTYDEGAKEGTMPSFESVDWVLNRRDEGRGWRVKLPASKVKSRGETQQREKAAATLRLSAGGEVSLTLLPIHIFIDLTIFDRLSPLVALLLDSLPSQPPPIGSIDDEDDSAPSTPRAATPTPGTTNHRVLHDLDAPPSARRASSSIMSVACELIRVEVRCPAPRSSEKGGQLRSGIFLVDVWDLEVGAGGPPTRIKWGRFVGAFAGAGSLRANGFLSLSALPSAPEGDEPPSPTAIPPQLTLSTTPTLSVIANIPLLHLSLTKPTLDGLQLFADDLTQYLARSSFSDSSSSMGDGESDGGRMIGSRYFGAKSFAANTKAPGSGSGSGGGEEGSEEGMGGGKAGRAKVLVTDIVVDLFIPTGEPQQGATRHIRGLVSDLEVEVALPKDEKNELRAHVAASDLSLSHIAPSSSRILSRTLPRNLTTTTPPVLSLVFSSSVEVETGLKESRIQLDLANFTYFLDARELEWVEEMARFAKAPAGAFETVVPNELTRIRLAIRDGSVHVTPPDLTDSHVVLSLEEFKLATNLMPDLPRTLIDMKVRGTRVLAVDSAGDLIEGAKEQVKNGAAYWKAKGFVQLLEVEKSAIQIRQGNGLVLPDLELLVSDTKLSVSICADSVASVGALVTDLLSADAFKGNATSPPPAPTASRRLPAHKTSSDLLASVDPAAFRLASSVNELPEYVDDDVPTNLEYLADALQQGSAPSTPTRTQRSGIGSQSEGEVISDVGGETIRMFDLKGLQILDDYLTVPRTDGDSAITPPSVIRCRLTNCDVTIHLHEGYDWSTTRKAIEEESKRVRRRLEKIRQLLASGQAPDASAEQASVLMFGSVQLGLPPGASELPAGQLLAAINEELDDVDDGATTTDAQSSVSSWQTLPGQSSGTQTASPSRKPTLVGKARKRLTRSKAFAIEVNLRGVGAQFDTHTQHQTAAKTRFDVNSFEIIDNIRTSTWKKFLTELRASDGGLVRASEAPMVRVELSQVRPVGSGGAKAPADAQNEVVLKIKIFPLRLYIDQDALDFLKAFGAFKVPAAGATPELEPSPSNEPFFQRVEILPVKIKLDYKPKRVDYHALRQGKTAELMNFFHFDGSEMTLRHLVVTGVSGSTRLSELVQDIWTPDVKANQLADVISGIAPVRSVVNVGSGVANLVLLPLEQYRKDGRLVRGLQKGASAFARQTTLEALNVGARLATGTQVILEQAEAVLGARVNGAVTTEALASIGPGGEAGSGLELTEEERVDLISRYAAQPGDLREGVESAYRSLGDNFRSAAQTILAVPMEVYERSGSEGPVRAVVRAVPIAVLKPMIGASEAVSKTLFGLRNTLDPELQHETADKYKQRPSAGSSASPL